MSACHVENSPWRNALTAAFRSSKLILTGRSLEHCLFKAIPRYSSVGTHTQSTVVCSHVGFISEDPYSIMYLEAVWEAENLPAYAYYHY